MNGVVDCQRVSMEGLKMIKFIRKTRLVREILLAAAAFLKVVEIALEIVNKAVNCRHVSKLPVHI